MDEDWDQNNLKNEIPVPINSNFDICDAPMWWQFLASALLWTFLCWGGQNVTSEMNSTYQEIMKTGFYTFVCMNYNEWKFTFTKIQDGSIDLKNISLLKIGGTQLVH